MIRIAHAFLADAVDASPGKKFAVIGGGVSRIGGPTFPLVHPHLSLLVAVRVSQPTIGNFVEPLSVTLHDRLGALLTSLDVQIGYSVSRVATEEELFLPFDFYGLQFAFPGVYTLVAKSGDSTFTLPLTLEHSVPPGVPPIPGTKDPSGEPRPETSTRLH